LKSIPIFNPKTNKEDIESRTNAIEMIINIFLYLMINIILDPSNSRAE